MNNSKYKIELDFKNTSLLAVSCVGQIFVFFWDPGQIEIYEVLAFISSAIMTCILLINVWYNEKKEKIIKILFFLLIFNIIIISLSFLTSFASLIVGILLIYGFIK